MKRSWVIFITKTTETLRKAEGFASLAINTVGFPVIGNKTNTILFHKIKNRFSLDGIYLEETELLPSYVQIKVTANCGRYTPDYLEDYFFWDVDNHKPFQYPMHWSIADKIGSELWNQLNKAEGEPKATNLLKAMIDIKLFTFDLPFEETGEVELQISPKKKNIPRYAWILKKGKLEIPNEDKPLPKIKVPPIMDQYIIDTEPSTWFTINTTGTGSF